VANPTTNYGFVLPTATDLVTDLPADFDVALQGVDTRLKALQPGTTLGDLAYSSATANTNTRLGVGSTGQVLTVAAGVPSWATPGGGSLTQLATGTLSGATTNVSGLSGSYKGLKAIVTSVTFATNGYNLELRFNNDSSGLYRHANAFATQSDANPTATEMSAVFIGGTSSNKNVSVIDVWDYANTTHWKFCQTYGLSEGTTAGYISTIAGQGIYKSTSAITAMTFFADGDTFTGGTYTIYGVN
jgi:hypothetical protein